MPSGKLPLEYAHSQKRAEMFDLLKYFSKPLTSSEIDISHAKFEDADDIANLHFPIMECSLR